MYYNKTAWSPLLRFKHSRVFPENCRWKLNDGFKDVHLYQSRNCFGLHFQLPCNQISNFVKFYSLSSIIPMVWNLNQSLKIFRVKSFATAISHHPTPFPSSYIRVPIKSSKFNDFWASIKYGYGTESNFAGYRNGAKWMLGSSKSIP